MTVIDEAVSELTCPNGQTTRQRSRTEKNTGYRYVFASRKCAGCPLRSECLENPGSAKGRSVIKNDYESEYGRVKAKAATTAYAEVRREHPKVERKLGELARHHGNRLARYRGRVKVLVQSYLCAWVVNVKRVVKLLTAPPVSGNGAQPVRAELGGLVGG